jgi:fumarate reductase flavoprotein subunit
MESGKLDWGQNLEAQMIVVGGGGAGMAAALAAAQAGVKKIIVLEKNRHTGGSSAMASGPFGAESPAQKRQAILAPKDELFRREMNWTHMRANPRILRAFIDKSGDTIAWLEKMGLFFYCVPHSPTDDPQTWHVSKGDGIEILTALARECEKLGVQVLLNTTAQKLLKDDQGRINGVLAEHEGRSIQVMGQTVLISSGGYAGNKEMLKKYCLDYREELKLAGAPNMGEGILMALAAGGAPDGLGYLMAGGPLAGGVLRLGPNNVRVGLGFLSGEPFSVWVNKKGRRFIDETESYNYYRCINALIRQPGAVCYALLDSDMIQYITDKGLSNVPEAKGYSAEQRSPLPGGLAEAIQSEAEKGNLKFAEDWDGIARGIGLDPAVLRNTIAEYNADCERGYDPVMAKNRRYLWPLRKPPYYALTCGAVLLNTLGGIKIDENMAVLDQQDDPLPGLYAAGVDTGGWTCDTYCADLPGTAFGYALNSGRIAGESMARYLKLK